jgi:hypothetical protein
MELVAIIKEAVCHEGGAIKALFPAEKEEVVKHRRTLSYQIVNNGQVIY